MKGARGDVLGWRVVLQVVRVVRDGGHKGSGSTRHEVGGMGGGAGGQEAPRTPHRRHQAGQRRTTAGRQRQILLLLGMLTC